MPYNCRSTKEYTNKKIAVASLSETATAILHYLKFAMIDSQLLNTIYHKRKKIPSFTS